MTESEVPVRRMVLASLSPIYTRLARPHLFDHVETFCMFIGHGRSGSSLVGALLNAHPNAVMSNELNVIDYVDKGLSRNQIFNLIYYMARRQAKQGSQGGGGYSYAVPNQWQGRHQQIRVIGDRKAGGTAIQIFRDRGRIKRLNDCIRLPVRYVHVVRNPFDTLATTVRKTNRQPGETEKSHLQRQVEHYFERAAAINAVIEENGEESVHFVHHEELMADPGKVLSAVCRYVGLEPSDEYLRDCSSILLEKPNITRDQITWTPEFIEGVSERMAACPWLGRYEYVMRD